MSDETCWVGIDVAKAALDVFLSFPEQTLSVGNDAAGFASLTATLQAAAPALIVLEATGGLEHATTSESNPATQRRCFSLSCPQTSLTWASTGSDIIISTAATLTSSAGLALTRKHTG